MDRLNSTRIYVAITVVSLSWLASAKPAVAQDATSQIAELYELQAAYHRAATVRDPANGDSAATITQRVRDVLALFTADAVLYLHTGGARDGYYIGNGDPDDEATCPTPSNDPNNRGTICSFYKYVSGAFQGANKFVALTPSYKEAFDVHGDVASIYFECHYFNVAIDPATGKPLWTAAAHANFNGEASKVDGRWLFAYAGGSVPPIPVP
jgi:hypothetical protein